MNQALPIPTRFTFPWPAAQALVATGIVLIVGGCSPNYQLDTAKVHGNVTLDGKPLTAGQVFFRPEKGRMAVGNIRPDGTYALFTYIRDGDDGAIVGHHKVTVVPSLTPATVEFAPETKSPIPEKYQSESTSGLEFTVEAAKDNQLDIALSSAK